MAAANIFLLVRIIYHGCGFFVETADSFTLDAMKKK